MSKKHTGIYVDLAYTQETTKVVVILEDNIEEIKQYANGTEFQEVVKKVVELMKKHNLSFNKLRASNQPAFEDAVRRRLGEV